MILWMGEGSSIEIEHAYDAVCDVSRRPCQSIDALLVGLRMITLAASIAVPIVVGRVWNDIRGKTE